jgi:hypothetical protein
MERFLFFLAGAGFGAWARSLWERADSGGAHAMGYPSLPSQGASAVHVWARTRSAMREIRALVIHAGIPDSVLEGKIRSRIGRTFARPDTVQVSVLNGIVSLRGAAREEEIRALTERISGLRGVKAVENNIEALTPPFTSWDDAEPGSRFPGDTGRLPQWIPIALAAVGAVLAFAGHRIRGGTGAGLLAGGAALAGAGAAGLWFPGAFAHGSVPAAAEFRFRRPGFTGSQSVASP